MAVSYTHLVRVGHPDGKVILAIELLRHALQVPQIDAVAVLQHLSLIHIYPALRRREVFPLTDEGRAAAAQYLKGAYDAEPERWNNCPDMMDCDPWEPPAEPDTANE